jgi:hypothetical protein
LKKIHYILLIFISINVISFYCHEAYFLAFWLRIFVFLKLKAFYSSIIALIPVLIGKSVAFLLNLTLKKASFIFVTGIAKRFFIDNILVKLIHENFIVFLKEPLLHLFKSLKNILLSFSLKKKIYAGLILFLPVSIATYVFYLFGLLSIIIEKILSAQIWKSLLVVFLKFFSSILFFFTDYIWNSWIEPLVEILIFTWVLKYIEKIPFIAPFFRKLYAFFRWSSISFRKKFRTFFSNPVKKRLKKSADSISSKIYSKFEKDDH